MANLIYVVAGLLVIGWAIGVFAFHATGLIHVLLVIALIITIRRVIRGRRVAIK